MFSKFITEVSEKAERIAEVVNGKVIIHRKGEVAESGNKDAGDFIRNTNMKYFGIESNELKGDFIEMHIPIANDKDSFLRFDIEHLYDMYQKGGDDAVERQIKENIEYAYRIEGNALSVIEDMSEYEKIKEKLIIRPLNLKNNKIQLDGFMYKTIGDIALVLYAVVLDDEESGCLNTVKIPREIFEKWNIDFDNVFLSTILNTNVFAMPRLYKNILKVSETSETESAFMASEFKESLKAETIPLVTTTRKTNGAIAMFYPGVKEKIAEMFNDSFYVAFTSVHEAMVHKRGTVDPESIKRHVRATNTTFGPEDTLSNEVFFFDREKGTFEVA